MVHRQEISISA